MGTFLVLIFIFRALNRSSSPTTSSMLPPHILPRVSPTYAETLWNSTWKLPSGSVKDETECTFIAYVADAVYFRHQGICEGLGLDTVQCEKRWQRASFDSTALQFSSAPWAHCEQLSSWKTHKLNVIYQEVYHMFVNIICSSEEPKWLRVLKRCWICVTLNYVCNLSGEHAICRWGAVAHYLFTIWNNVSDTKSINMLKYLT
jgi:hypothetical protein